MTSNGWADALLAVIVLAPMAAIVVPSAVALPADDRQWTILGCSASAVGAFVLLVAGQHPHVSRLAPDDLALAAAGATAALALSVRPAAQSAALAAATTVALCGVVAGAPGRPSSVGPLLAVAGASALLGSTRQTAGVLQLATGAGVITAGAGVHAGGRGGAGAVIIGVALMVIASTAAHRDATAVLVPSALVLSLRVAPVLAGTANARWLAVALAGAAAVIALTPVPVIDRVSGPAAVLALWVLVAAVEPVPGTASAARVLGAATIFVLVLGGPLAMLSALPGVAMAVAAVADGGGWVRAVLGALLAVSIAGAMRCTPAAAATRIRGVDAVAIVLAVWLVVRPTAWTWARVGDVVAYSDGTVLALAAGSIAAVALAARGEALELMHVGTWLLRDGTRDQPLARRLVVAVFVVTAATGIATALLLRSARL